MAGKGPCVGPEFSNVEPSPIGVPLKEDRVHFWLLGIEDPIQTNYQNEGIFPRYPCLPAIAVVQYNREQKRCQVDSPKVR